MSTRSFDGAHVATIKPSNKIKRWVKDAKKNKKNRVYYDKIFEPSDIRDSGIIQCDEKSIYDQVTLDESRNESIELYGFDSKGSYFSLSTIIVSLYPNVDRLGKESRWRLAKVNFLYINAQNKCKYTYKCDQLIDYEFKRNNSQQHDTRNLWKIGSLSIEAVLPFSLTRILFNGQLLRRSPEGVEEFVSAKLTISTHPTSDKFDYQYRFDELYLSERLTEQTMLNAENSPEVHDRLLSIVLEDRIDQTLMFQGHLELFGQAERGEHQVERFIMWGAKLKRFVDPHKELATLESDKPVLRETLLAWNECGHTVHLTRPLGEPSVIYGLINNTYEYTSPLSGSKYVPQPPETREGQQGAAEAEEEKKKQNQNSTKGLEGSSCFDQLDSFKNLKPGSKINLRAYQKKDYTIEVLEADQLGLMKINLNGFDGWALIGNDLTGNLGQQLREAQNNLWALNISDSNERKLLNFSHLASERLLGGKGNSLIELDRFIKTGSLGFHGKTGVQAVSVPRGIVVSCLAYQVWLNSDPRIRKSITELDTIRRTLAARSVNLNPLSENYLSLAQTQQILREHCKRAHEKLISCPLPAILRENLRSMLMQIFTGEELGLVGSPESGKLFAVRSSAVGEDSLETSAAGQMRTILDARGFDAICRSIVDCWSSQFELEALTYKTQNGLPLNLPMAVVVQELIACKSAGVAATCDPLTGDKRRLEILANAGLGEGVVSGGEADTIRVSLKSLGWNEKDEHCLEEQLSLDNAKDCIEKVGSESQLKNGDETSKTCCLTDAQIVALANLLINLRKSSEIKDREVEWGITMIEKSPEATKPPPSSSSSSSSSSSGNNDNDYDNSNSEGAENAEFHIYLLQSRPLTHLFRLSSHEIDHELDHGFNSHLDVVSRANVGEVMPGAMCPLTTSHFLTVCPRCVPHGKPFEENHTYKPFTGTGFGTHGRLVCLVLTYSDTIDEFMRKEVEMSENESPLRVMLGTGQDSNVKNLLRIVDLTRERANPLSRIKSLKIFPLLVADSGVLQIKTLITERLLKKTLLEDDLVPIERLIERFLEAAKNQPEEQQQQQITNWQSDTINNQLRAEVRNDVVKLFDRLCKNSQPLICTWLDHMASTVLSMMLNIICIRILNKQPAYGSGSSDNENNDSSSKVLNDFSILVQGGPKTESGDIMNLMKQVIEALEEEGKLEETKQMDTKELYKLLTADGATKSKLKSASLYERFMKSNGHRAFKEFDYATSTWADDPSYIMKSLAARLKQNSAAPLINGDGGGGNVHLASQVANQLEVKKRQAQMDEILAKVVSGRALLVAYALPRARNAIARREGTKSQLIRAVDKYRRAFRHLGGLLCLEGRLPSAGLIFQLTIEELDRLVRAQSSGDFAGILYKARRRQQRARVLERAAFPRPTLDFDDMVEIVRRFSGGLANDDQGSLTKSAGSAAPADAAGSHLVRGMTSCAGYVTGRACVVSSLDDVDQIQPNDILITYSIDISWSVYFFTLAGIVTEVGGIVSHGAVVAREYGIPTLCTAVGACSMFETGQIVTLDANQGTCYLASEGGQGDANLDGSSHRSQIDGSS